MRTFRRVRPRDINVEAAVASVTQELVFYIFEDPALNTCDLKLASEHVSEGRPPIKEVAVSAVPLWKLLDQYVPRDVKIDLLTIDVEGLDYDVLRSNDWEKYSPEYILVECLGTLTLDNICSDKVTQFLSEHHYSGIAKTIHTVLYKRTLP
jgi:FkbM family methyltransferase